MKTNPKIIRLVIARLEVWPEDAKLAIVGLGTSNKKELITHVKKGTDVGRKIVEIELEYLKSLKKGILYA